MSTGFDPISVIEAPVKKELPLFFVVDRSSSMKGERIGEVNAAIRDVIPALRSVGGSDANISAAVLTFSSDAQWHTKLTPVENFTWGAMDAGGLTCYGAALKELASKLSRHEFLNQDTGYARPVIIMMSDGQPTDEWQAALTELKKNKWFQLAIKLALAIGDEAELDPLISFTGNREAVLIAPTPDELAKLIRVIAVKSSEIGSRSMMLDLNGSTDINALAEDQTIKEIKEGISSDLGTVVTAADIDQDF